MAQARRWASFLEVPRFSISFLDVLGLAFLFAGVGRLVASGHGSLRNKDRLSVAKVGDVTEGSFLAVRRVGRANGKSEMMWISFCQEGGKNSIRAAARCTLRAACFAAYSARVDAQASKSCGVPIRCTRSATPMLTEISALPTPALRPGQHSRRSTRGSVPSTRIAPFQFACWEPDHQEFVSAEPEHLIAIAHKAQQRMRHVADRCIANQMPGGVVDDLELVDVNQPRTSTAGCIAAACGDSCLGASAVIASRLIE